MIEKHLEINILSRNTRIKAETGKRLIESLMGENIFLRNDCGGKGSCGKCAVEVIEPDGMVKPEKACQLVPTENISINIPHVSMLSPHIINKTPAMLPAGFEQNFSKPLTEAHLGVAADIGTTTIALYLCNMKENKVLSSLAIKNPQTLYGDDVMSRIAKVGLNKKNLKYLQRLVVGAIEWGIKELLTQFNYDKGPVSKMVAVGNPTMIHIFLGVDPKPIGISPYQPAFYDARNIPSDELDFKLNNFQIHVLPQVSGFIGGDIISAAIAINLENKPDGTLLIDLGTNGELILKANGSFFATSCATGPAFEGATLSCGMQAIPGAIDQVLIKNNKDFPEYTFINPNKSKKIRPLGLCGVGVISAVTQLRQKKILESNGAFNKNLFFSPLRKDPSGKLQYIIVPEGSSQSGSAIFISQKDIRSVQLGKAALITGIEFLLKKACIEKPDAIIVAGAFGAFLNKEDMMTLGMIPPIDPSRVKIVGNAAGAGGIMALCDERYLKKSIQMAKKISVVDLACDQNFQHDFIENLSFPFATNFK